MATSIQDVATSLEQWAPTGSAESWDNVGLHVGDPSRDVSKGLIALDMTPHVLEEAKSVGAQLIVTHHPLLFKPIDRLTSDHAVGHLALKLAEAGIALYCIHTNLDAAKDGVSFALAGQLGLKNIQFLGNLEERLVKLAVFVPSSHADAVKESMTGAGAGRIGNYDSCSFTISGTGAFRALEGSNPNVGEAGGDVERVEELRIEVEVARWNLPTVLQALHEAHPYDEVAYDIFPMEQPFRSAGIGAIGELPSSESLTAFLTRVSTALQNKAVRFVGDLDSPIQRVAVCGGAGSRFMHLAMNKDADAYVTADITYHHFFETLDADGNPKMALVDPGHYETESVTEAILIEYLSKNIPNVDWHRTSTRTAPVKTFVHSS
ncbi:MAG: Nif3-like dinuclear metal center hexameric protein [Rhodothermia bacterium]|nr:MAG: Nif3-like dinuclear metal center hexameric protein [Rhodothermia bacterium]